MKVDKIIPCVCCDHEPNCGDSVYYGMPRLKVCGGKPYTWFEVYCPNCGRGGLLQFKSAYLALKHWNKMQENLRRDVWSDLVECQQTPQDFNIYMANLRKKYTEGDDGKETD